MPPKKIKGKKIKGKKVVGVNKRGININIQLDQSKRGNNSNNKKITQTKNDLQKSQPSIVPVPFQIPFYMPREQQPVQQPLSQPVPRHQSQEMGVQHTPALQMDTPVSNTRAQARLDIPLEEVPQEQEPETQGVSMERRSRADMGVYGTPISRGRESLDTQNNDTIDSDMQNLQAKLHELQRTTPIRKRFEDGESFIGVIGKVPYNMVILKTNAIRDVKTNKYKHKVQVTGQNGRDEIKYYSIDTLTNARSLGNTKYPPQQKAK